MPRSISDPDTGKLVTLQDEHYRLLLLYKALANISPADARSLTTLLRTLTGTGIAGWRHATCHLSAGDAGCPRRWAGAGGLP